MPTITGKVFIANETDRTYLFTGLDIDWPDEGYALSIRITDPTGQREWVQLTEVPTNGEHASSGINTIVYDVKGRHVLKLVAHAPADTGNALDDRTKWKLASDDFPVKVLL